MSFKLGPYGRVWESPQANYEPISMAAAALASVGSTLAGSIGTIGTVASVLGTGISAIGAIKQGEAAQQEAEFKAKQLEQKANEERAVGQRQMFDKRRQTDLVQSQLRARAAGSTGDTTDTGVLNLGGQIETLGEYDALGAMYRGENAARGYQDMASAARLSGENAKTASYWKAGGTLLDGVSSLSSKLSKTPMNLNRYA